MSLPKRSRQHSTRAFFLLLLLVACGNLGNTSSQKASTRTQGSADENREITVMATVSPIAAAPPQSPGGLATTVTPNKTNGSSSTAAPISTLTPTFSADDMEESLLSPKATPPIAKSPVVPAAQFEPTDMAQDELAEWIFATGGASPGVSYFGISQGCLTTQEGALSLSLTGVFSYRNRYREANPNFAEMISTPCKEVINDAWDFVPEPLELGDMLYFVARGFEAGEVVHFTVRGPQGEEHYSTRSERVTLVDDRSRTIHDHFTGARFSWVPSGGTGVGEHVLTASGASRTLSLPFTVTESEGPNFGARFGTDERHPLLLQTGEQLQITLVGFPPNHTVTVLLYRGIYFLMDLDVASSNKVAPQWQINEAITVDPLRALEITVDSNGTARLDISWPAELPSGMYVLMVPELIRQEASTNPAEMYHPQQHGPWLYSLPFGVVRDDSEIEIFAGSPYPDRPLRVVNVASDDVLNIREGPPDYSGELAPVVGTIPSNGRGIYIIATDPYSDSSWVAVEYGSQIGWVNSRYLVLEDSP